MPPRHVLLSARPHPCEDSADQC
ncbi:hypothetical protein VCHC47A1_2353, partial [Vibrio cholerae HC-47A1]